MFRWNELQVVRFVHIYRVRPKRKQVQWWMRQGGWGPVLAIAWRGRMLVIGFHLGRKAHPLSKERSEELWKEIERRLAEDKQKIL